MDKEKKIRLIEVVPHNPNWYKEFLKESGKVRDIYQDEIVDIHHIGSTAIPEIYSKPIIDILIEVKDINNIDKDDKSMDRLEYIAKGEYGIAGRRFFIKGLYNRTHHVHVFETGSPEVQRHLDFRDYMIVHPEDAKRYSELKISLSKKFMYDNEGYCKGKNDYISEIDERAKEWRLSR